MDFFFWSISYLEIYWLISKYLCIFWCLFVTDFAINSVVREHMLSDFITWNIQSCFVSQPVSVLVYLPVILEICFIILEIFFLYMPIRISGLILFLYLVTMSIYKYVIWAAEGNVLKSVSNLVAHLSISPFTVLNFVFYIVRLLLLSRY